MIKKRDPVNKGYNAIIRNYASYYKMASWMHSGFSLIGG